MEGRIAMTQDALLDALEEAFQYSEEDDGALTTRQLADSLGISMGTARERIRVLLDEGKAEPVKVPRPGIDGVVQPTRAYRLKAAA